MSEKPRVRFAPSPTGELHVGNARTALYNWLFARHHGGILVLRIEDTDRERTTREFEQGILRELQWLGIQWDEGPEKNGQYGPYNQCERLELYEKSLDKLKTEDRVYPCYCTDKELEAERARLISLRQTPRYMGKCRNLTDGERMKLEAQGRKPAYRFKVGTGVVEFNDLIRGTMRFDCDSMGDFIIVRSNGIPAYNFAVVVDDHLMKISHVIRGEDHLSNTALQLLIYRALGLEPPRFAHHALMLGKDRSKLSKRHGSVSVREFREKGILPEAFLNYLSLLGSSFGGEKEVCSLEEIIKSFSLSRAGKSGAIFDEKKLMWLNGIYMRNVSPEKLTELLQPFINSAGIDCPSRDQTWLISVVRAVKDNLTTLADFEEYLGIFVDDSYAISEDAAAILREKSAGEVVRSLHDALLQGELTSEDIYRYVIDRVARATGLKGRKLLMPIRAAVTGKVKGPELDKIFDLLEKKSLLRRVEAAMAITG